MPGFVADASATLPWYFADEATPATEALLDRLRSGRTCRRAGSLVYGRHEWPPHGRTSKPARSGTGCTVYSRLGGATPGINAPFTTPPIWNSRNALVCPSLLSTAICENSAGRKRRSCGIKPRLPAGYFTWNK
jgi:hypothetical protein